tara:strand:- start:2469 stop:3749 length:1281 start_codon:yes stop_codon:yes gene_type:complete
MGCKFHVVTTTQGFWSSQHEDAEPVQGVMVDRVEYPDNLVMRYLKLTQWGIKRLRKDVRLESSSDSGVETRRKNVLLSGLKGSVGKVLRRLSLLPQPLADSLAFPHYSKYWTKHVVSHCTQQFVAADFDIIIASHPYAGTLLAAKELSKQWGIPWVADFRDPWTHDMQSPLRDNQPMLARMWEFEGETLGTASAVVSINRQMCEYLNAPDDKMHVITNSYEPSDYSFDRVESRSVETALHLCYTGNIADDHEYRLFLDGLKSFQENSEERVIFNYYGGAFSKLSAYASKIGLDQKVLKNHGYVKHEEANQKLAEADCGVVFGWRGPLAKLVSTGKIFDSLGVESPILGICSVSGSGMEDIIVQSGAGSVLNSEQEIADWLARALEVKGRARRERLLAPSCSEKNRVQYSTKKVAEAYLLLLRTLIN